MSERLLLLGPSGRFYVAELDYAEGHVESTGSPWRGWRVRYHLQGELLSLALFIDGDESEPPEAQHVARACDLHYTETVAAVRELPRWRRAVLDPRELEPDELYAELEHDLELIAATRDASLVRAGELRLLELARELERRKLPLPADARRRLSGN